MNKRFGIILFLIITFTASGILFLWWQAGPPVEQITINGVTVPPLPILDAEAVSQGREFYGLNCASCHGTELEGVSNWNITQSDGTLLPPPHDSSGHTWHHPDALLIRIISEGGQPENGNMPAFGDIMSEDEIIAVLAYIKTSWGTDEREVQWWISSTQNSLYE
jgi:mono/diheme cytochrome c family protein